MALFKCPICNERTSNIGSSCSKCGNIFSENMKESAKIQIKENKDNRKADVKGTLGCIAIIAFIAVFVGLLIYNMSFDNRMKSYKGYCNNCGRKSSFTVGSFDYCSSCYDAFLRYKDNKK